MRRHSLKDDFSMKSRDKSVVLLVNPEWSYVKFRKKKSGRECRIIWIFFIIIFGCFFVFVPKLKSLKNGQVSWIFKN